MKNTLEILKYQVTYQDSLLDFEGTILRLEGLI
jgi:hypothetical protein